MKASHWYDIKTYQTCWFCNLLSRMNIFEVFFKIMSLNFWSIFLVFVLCGWALDYKLRVLEFKMTEWLHHQLIPSLFPGRSNEYQSHKDSVVKKKLFRRSVSEALETVEPYPYKKGHKTFFYFLYYTGFQLWIKYWPSWLYR